MHEDFTSHKESNLAQTIALRSNLFPFKTAYNKIYDLKSVKDGSKIGDWKCIKKKGLKRAYKICQ